MSTGMQLACEVLPISALDEAMFEHEAANPEQVSMRQ